MSTAPYETCTYILTRGTLCESPALKGAKLCYFHYRDAQRKENLQQARELKCSDQFYKYPMQQELLNPEIVESLDIPALDDGASIQVAVTNIVRLVLSGHISDKRAGLALFGCQIAAINLGKANIGVGKYDADKAATTDANPIPPFLTTKPHPAGYEEELRAARKLIDTAQKLSRSGGVSEAGADRRNPEQSEGPASREKRETATLETRNEKLETTSSRHSEARSAEEPASPATPQPDRALSDPGLPTAPLAGWNRSGFERVGGSDPVTQSAVRETGNGKPETPSRDSVRVWRRPPGPNSKTFAEHIKLADALYKGKLAAEEFKKEEKNARGGSSS
jgi:hypothetical protein